MGYFSWKTSDTNRSISNRDSVRGTFPVYVLLPDGGYIEETDYDGYGRFGDQDIYALVARWNLPEECNGDEEHDRHIGIHIACYDEKNAALKYPIKIVEDPTITYEEAKPATNDPDQGYFYEDEDEAWYEEEEEW